MGRKTIKNVPAIQGDVGPGRPPKAKRFKPGQSGNPKGRPSAGLSVREWWNQMQGWSLAKIQAVMADRDAAVCKVAAARAWIDATSADRNASGTPIAGADLDRIIDRTEGKPVNTADIRNGEGNTIIEIRYTQTPSGNNADD